VHDVNQAATKDLHSNHELLVSDGANIKDAGGITTLSNPNVNLKFYTKKVILFKVNNI